MSVPVPKIGFFKLGQEFEVRTKGLRLGLGLKNICKIIELLCKLTSFLFLALTGALKEETYVCLSVCQCDYILLKIKISVKEFQRA